MVDNLSTSAAPGTFQDDTESRSGLAAFLSTTKGRLAIGAVVLVVVIGALSAIVFLFLLRPATAKEPSAVAPAGSVSTSATADGEAEAAVPERTKPLSSTFVFRDVFEPAIKPTVTKDSGSNGGSSGGTGGSSGESTGTGNGEDQPSIDVPADTLYLESINTADGKTVANLIWNDQDYEAAEGERLGETPWKVLDISGNSVVMLYGDTRVTLTVGQGVSK